MSDATRLLHDLAAGDRDAAQRLLPLVYGELHRLACHSMRDQAPDHTLQPTALVHEAWMRLVERRQPAWDGRRHFLSIAAKAMRNVLIDHARRRQAGKRGAGRRPLQLDEQTMATEADESILAVHRALGELARVDPGLAELVELRFFGGLGVEDAAAVLGMSPSTVKRSWRVAKAWLRRALGPEPPR